jgi:hypothetical protein
MISTFSAIGLLAATSRSGSPPVLTMLISRGALVPAG